VIAKNTWAAMKGRDALKIVWDDGPNASFDSAEYKKLLEENVRKPGRLERGEGDVDAALKSAAKVITAEYYSPHIAHATMEPPSATARIADGKVEVWTSTQSPGGARDDIAKRLGYDQKNVVLHEMLLGGGFGRKSKWDYAIEAALLSKAMDGAPVKVVWTREDDIKHGFYHTVTAERLEAGLDKDNKVIAWQHRSSEPVLELQARRRLSRRRRAGPGLCRYAIQRAQCPARKRVGAVACADRLVPVGQQRATCLGDAILHR